MHAKTIVAASLAALAFGLGAPSIAATAAQSGSEGSGLMQQNGGSGQNSPMMGNAASPGAMGSGMMGMRSGGQGDAGASHASIREGGHMQGGMMGMMEGCPMAMGAGLDRKTAMKMHGEMMRAMGDILIKYADQVQEPAAKQ